MQQLICGARVSVSLHLRRSPSSQPHKYFDYRLTLFFIFGMMFLYTLTKSICCIPVMFLYSDHKQQIFRKTTRTNTFFFSFYKELIYNGHCAEPMASRSSIFFYLA